MLYCSTATGGQHDHSKLLATAVTHLLNAVQEEQIPTVLWSLSYDQSSTADAYGTSPGSQSDVWRRDRVVRLPPVSLGPSFDDHIIETVRDTWLSIMGNEADEAPFMAFEDREEMANAGDSEEEPM